MSFGPRDQNEEFIFALENLRADFQYAVLKALKQQGISQAELARRLGVSAPWVSQILSDEANITIESAARVIAALKLDLSFREMSEPAEAAAAVEEATTPPLPQKRSGNAWQEINSAKPLPASSEAGPASETAVFMHIVVRQSHSRRHRSPIVASENFSEVFLDSVAA